ncbi:MAG: hypothetical protein R6V40_04615 [Candidatus Moraniibacteriota bacterium]
MCKKREAPNWLKIETSIIIFFLLVLTLGYFRISAECPAEREAKVLIEYIALSGSLVLIWIISWIAFLVRGY